MSYALTTYVVDLDVLHASVGSGDDKLRRMIGGRFKRQLDGFSYIGGEDDIPIRDAIRAVIEGGPFEPRHGTMYNYAYKWICEFHGGYLDNNDFSPMRSGWLGTVDKGLKAVGVTAVGVEDFGFGHAPEPIPEPDFLPGSGEWSPEQCRKALEQWAAATDEDKAGLDPDVRQAAESCMEWCRAADAAGRGVAGFFS
ncbi:hypothetical protein [Nocardiopsis sp. CC223A]|uniref:DUF7691 family protein n=1 Tax=Nocardiopsis sp. CC223A TaxID=3044051 RepID=UPI00278C7483|nr:hypothetical protein [Nocardiopsis sp. CC223A]